MRKMKPRKGLTPRDRSLDGVRRDWCGDECKANMYSKAYTEGADPFGLSVKMKSAGVSWLTTHDIKWYNLLKFR